MIMCIEISVLILTILYLSMTHPFQVFDWPGNLGRSSQALLCDGRFYKGYRMKKGDRGDMVFKKNNQNNLCLWKFFPTSCTITFSCSLFKVSSGSDQATCSSKLITKKEGEIAMRWCGQVRPPQEERQILVKKPFLVGYFALLTGITKEDDEFHCKIGCHTDDQLLTASYPPKVQESAQSC